MNDTWDSDDVKIKTSSIRHKCCECGKVFLHVGQYAYKHTVGSRHFFFCGWNCMRKWEKAHGDSWSKTSTGW